MKRAIGMPIGAKDFAAMLSMIIGQPAPDFNRSYGPGAVPFGSSKHSVARDRRAAKKRRAVKRARKLRHA